MTDRLPPSRPLIQELLSATLLLMEQPFDRVEVYGSRITRAELAKQVRNALRASLPPSIHGPKSSDVDDQTERCGEVMPQPPTKTERFDTPEGFIDWFGKNYNGEVVFSDPAWHARIIYRTARWHCLRPGGAAATQTTERQCVWCNRALVPSEDEHCAECMEGACD